MQVFVEKTSELSRKMTVSIPDAVVLEKMESRLKSLAREVKVAGFRPGKVPAKIVQKLYGDRVRSEITGDLIESSFHEALQQENLVPAGQPHIEPVDIQEKFEYIAEFEVYPEISLGGIAQLQISRPISSVTEADIDNMLEKLREQKKTWQIVERPAETGDQVTINFSGVADGENFTNGKTENFTVEIGGGQMIPGFEAQLTGLSAGSSKTFTIDFPENYNNAQLAGKNAEFDIEVLSVAAGVLPPLDPEFIQAYGVESGDLTEFRADVQANMERELLQGLKSRLKSNVLDVLYENIAVATPNALVDREIQIMLQSYAEQAKRVGLQAEDILSADIISTFEPQAKRRVALSLIMSEIIQTNKIIMDPLKVRAVIDDIAKSYEDPQEVINWYYSDRNHLNDIQQVVLEDQAIEWIVSQANVTEEALSFSEVMEKHKIGA